MKKLIWIILLALVFEVLITEIVYSQEGEPYRENIQFVVKKFSRMAAEKILIDWERSIKQEAKPTVDVSGTWCFIKKSVFSEEELGRVKMIMELQQDSKGIVSGNLQNFFLANNEWHKGRRFIIEGKVNENILTGNLDSTGKVLLSFKGNTFEGMIIGNTALPDIIEIVAVRCSVQR